VLDTTAIENLIAKAQQFPALAHTYAAELDRLFRAAGERPVTFSANAWANESVALIKRLGLKAKFGGAVASKDDKVILTAEALMKEGKRGDAFAHAFTHASGTQVNALNLFYANHASQSSSTRVYYLNKYLSAYHLGITLKEDASADFFQRITSTDNAAKVDGPLVTVIMPARNAETTIELALGSLLNQIWRNLQIIVVDDASTDGTLQKAQELAKRDYRIEVLRSPVNVGPYVCRNLGVVHTRGKWLTVHDADDWAFPDRIERQIKALEHSRAMACTGRMLRMSEQGKITRPTSAASAEDDGYLRLCFVSLMVQTAFFRNELGAWDSVRVGGDAELIERINVLGTRTTYLRRPLMLCLDNGAGLTNHQELGLADETGQTLPLRTDYKRAFTDWHKTPSSKKLTAFAKTRLFDAPTSNLVDQGAIKKVFANWSKSLELLRSSELFEADWYLNKYPEVELTGLEPAAHYLAYGTTGETDPGPNFNSRFYLLTRSTKTNPLVHMLRGKGTDANPKRVLLAAAEVAKTGDHQQAINLAETHLPQNLDYTVEILRANSAIERGDEAGWQTHVNGYLAQFGVAPIRLLQGAGNAFDRLACDPLPAVTGGPLISVIMPAWNAEKTVRKAAQSILDQTWRNLELLIVDDASTDGTWTVLQAISHSDERVKIFRNKVNVGPYVSKNIALTQCKGEWITGHDADDWAFPQRLEKQHLFVVNNYGTRGLLSGGLRMNPVSGHILGIGNVSDRREDGVIAPVSISGFFEREFLLKQIGAWDSSRFGADSELINRCRILLGDNFKDFIFPCELYMDTPSSLTNQRETAFNSTVGISPLRAAYRSSWMNWHSKSLNADNAFIEFPQYKRQFDIPCAAFVPVCDVEECLN
jgi:glycosyltransferase involved in cell wall biosynthesis